MKIAFNEHEKMNIYTELTFIRYYYHTVLLVDQAYSTI